MMKRSLALLLAMVMVLSMLPMGVLAEEQPTAEKNTAYTGPLEQHVHAATGDSHICEHCVAAGLSGTEATPQWQAWGDDDAEKHSLPHTEGHWYLTQPITDCQQGEEVTTGDIVLCLNGYTVTAKADYRFYTLNGDAKVTISDCTAHYEESDTNVEYDTGYRAGKLTGGTASGILFVDNGNNAATLTWYDGILSNCYRDGAGGAVCVQGKGKLYMYGGEISDCYTTSGNGGAIYKAANATVELENVSLLRNTAAGAGGAISLFGSVSLKNTLVAGNTATSRSAIDGNGSGAKITLDSCEITGNMSTATTWHYGTIFLPNASGRMLKIQGSTYIYNNFAGNGKQANIYFQNASPQAVITVGDTGLAEGTKIGITMDSNRQNQGKDATAALPSGMTAAQVSEYFVSDNAAKRFTLVGGKARLTDGHTHANCPGCSLEACTNAGGHASVTYTALKGDIAAATLDPGGNFYLTGDATLKGAVALGNGETLNICLAGYKLTLGSSRFNLSGTAKLNVTDCTASTKPLTGEYVAGSFGYTSNSSAFRVNTAGTDTCVISLYDGILTGCNRSNEPAVGYLNGKGTFNMFGGKITDNHTSGTGKGIISVNSSAASAFSMYGGEISNNSAAGGGGVFRGVTGKINLLGGTICGNSTAGSGGVIFGESGSALKIENATVSNNTAAVNGGAIYAKGGSVTVKNAKITGNTANSYSAILGDGGGVQITLDGAEITGNTATGSYTGGAIYIPNNGAKITVQGATKVSDNTGGNVYLVKDANTTNPNHPMITVGEEGLKPGTKIGIYMPIDRFSAQPYASVVLGGKLTKDQVTEYFFSDNSMLEVVMDESQDRVQLQAGDDHAHCVCGVDGCTEHEQIRCLPWTKTDTLPNMNGHWYLTQDLNNVKEAILDGANVVVCLNGKTVTAKSGQRYYRLNNSSTLTIVDHTAKEVTPENDQDTGYRAGKLTNATASGILFDNNGENKSVVNWWDGIMSNTSRDSAGGAFAVQGAGKLNVYDGEFDNCQSKTGSGGLIYLGGGSCSANLANATIKNCSAVNGGAIATPYGGVVSVKDCTFTGNSATGDGGAIYNQKSTVTVDGGVFSENVAKGESTNEDLKHGGGAIHAVGGTLTIKNATISNNKTDLYGGAILTQSGVKVTDTGSDISKNNANRGGAIFASGGSLTLTGTKITENEAKMMSAIEGAGGVKITLDGAEITGNKATTTDGETYGAVYIPNNSSKIIVQGETKVKGNHGGNIYLRNNKADQPVITLGEKGLATGAKIGITMLEARKNAEPYASAELKGALKDAQVAEYFFCDNSRYEITLKNDRLHVAKFYLDEGHKHCLCDASAASCDHDRITWLSWDDPTKLPTSGNYCLTVDVKTSANVSLTGTDTLNLCLNGHTITATGANQGTWQDRIFDIKEEATLNITDCTGKGQLTGGTYGVILFEDNQNSKTTFNLYGGNLTGNKGLNYGGAVLVQGAGTFNMYGGAIHGNNMNGTAVVDAQGNPVLGEDGAQKTTGTSYGGGAIGLNGTKTTFNMYGGKIYDNECMLTTYLDKEGKETTAGGRGGAIYSTRGTVNIYGGEISGNRANQGGAIYAVIYSKINVAGGTIAENTTGSQGAGIFADNCTVTVSGGKVTKNVSEKGAGGIQISNGKGLLTVTGGEITENEGYYGGGIMCQGRASISIEGGLIARNKADTAGGVYIATLSPAKMTGGTIAENEAKNNAGGMYALRTVLNMTGGEISGNKAGGQGGALYIYGATLNLDGGVLKNNTAKNGGAISTGRLTVTGKLEEHVGINALIDSNGKLECRATINVINGSVEGNSSTGSGGAMLMQGYATLNIKGGEIKNNTTKASGGGVYLSDNCTVDMTGGTFSGNHADGTGGGLYMVKSKGTFSGGVFEKNTTKKQGAGLCTSHSEVKLSGVKIRNHNHKGVGAGYTGFNSDTTMSGGSITGNYAGSYGAGMYLQRGKLTVTGGSMSYNTTKGTGAAIYLAGIKTNIYGGYFAGNKCEGTGGAVLFTARWGYTENGVKKEDVCDVNIAGGTFTENYGRNGGAMLIQSGATLKITGGTFTKNEGPQAGGAMYISNNIKFEITGGTFAENKTNVDGGAINFNGAQGVMDGSSGKLIVENNYAKRYGGGFNITGEKADVTVKNLKVSDNSVSNRGGGVAVNTKAHANFENVEICNNHSEIQGGGFYMGHGPIVYMKNSKIHNNKSDAAGAAIATECVGEMTLENVVITENETLTKSGGIYTRAAKMHLINCEVTNNVAGGDGGGVATGKLFSRGGEIGSGGKQPGLIIENSKITGNTCVGAGGGVHLNPGNYCTIINSEISGNTSGTEGSGIWTTEHLKMVGMTVTGNTSNNDGYAVFIADASYDGQSYIQALLEMGGDVIIKDNQGGDMYMGAMNAIATTAEGLGENTNFNITLNSGVLTKRLLGVYDYQKAEDGIYTVTYGTRSMTEPEKDPAMQSQNGDVLLYIGVGAFVVAVAAVVVLLLLKKKKAKTPAAPAVEE